MKIAIMQPYLFPYIGYFQLIHSSDIFVIYDDVNYIKNGWINRNQINHNGEKNLFTLNLSKASPNKLINKIEIIENVNNRKKIIKNIISSYQKAPFYKNIMPFIEKLILNPELNLAKYVTQSIEKITQYLEIKTKIVLSSKLDKNNLLKGKERVINIVNTLNGTEYINPIGGLKLYSKETFGKNNIDLKFLKTNDINYKQYNDTFLPNLSIIDVLMFNSIDQIKHLLNNYELI